MSRIVKYRDWLFRVLLTFGILLVAAAWRIATADGWATKLPLMLASLGVAMIACGLLKSNAARMYRYAALTAANVVVLLFCLETGAACLHRLTADKPDEVAQSSVVRDFYVGWRSSPFSGDVISIDGHGYRVTTPKLNQRPDVRIFAFGGSTMWGEGASDSETIPSWLQQKLNRRANFTTEVSNFGQRGWVATQSLMELVTQLREGNVPDVVVFYDGYNDTTAACSTQGEIGMPENFAGLTSEPSLKSTLRSTLKKSDLIQMIPRPQGRSSFVLKDTAGIAERVIKNYKAVHDIVLALGQQYGFEVHFFWQPQLYRDPKTLSVEERSMLESHPWLQDAVKAMFDETYPRARKLAAETPKISDLSQAFGGLDERVYFDPCHITGHGNALVADSMLLAGFQEVVLRATNKESAIVDSDPR